MGRISGLEATMTLNAVSGAGAVSFANQDGAANRNQWQKLVVNEHAIFVNNGGLVDTIVPDNIMGLALASPLADAITLNGGTLRTALNRTYNISANRGITLGALGGTLNATATGHAWTVDSVITGSGNLTVTGTNATAGSTITLSGANTHTGTTTLTAGVMILGNSLALQNSALNTTGSVTGAARDGIRTSQTALTFGGLTGNKALASLFSTTSGGYSGVTALTLNPGTGENHSYSAVIANGASGMTLTKTGAGTQTLSGTNTFTGALSVQNGTLSIPTINNASANGTLGNSATAVTLGSSGLTGTLQYTGSTASSTKPFTLATSGTGAIEVTTAGTALTLSGLISGSGALNKTGSGTLTLSGTNSYTGATTVSAGTLRAGAAASGQAFGNGSAVTMANVSGATLDLNNFSQTVGSLAGGGGTGGNVTLGSGTLTTGGNNTSTSYSGVISGSGGLTKNGSGTQTLTGANSYTGATTVNAGRLIVGSGGSGSITSAVTVNSGGTLGGSGTITGNVTINSSGIHAPGNSPGIQTVTGNLTYESGSIFAWDLDANKSNNSGGGIVGTDYDGVDVSGTLDIDPGAVFRVVIGDNVDFGNSFWASTQSWSDIFDYGSLTGGWAADTPVDVYTFDSATNTYTYVDVEGSFTITGTTLNWTPIPEPGSVLAGALIGAGLLRRRRPAANPAAK